MAPVRALAHIDAEGEGGGTGLFRGRGATGRSEQTQKCHRPAAGRPIGLTGPETATSKRLGKVSG